MFPQTSRHVNFQEFLRSRLSIRRFSTEPVPAQVIERIIETATYAPSAHNRQPWRFAVVTDTSAKSDLAEAMGAEFRRDLENDGLASEEIEGRIAKSRSRIGAAPVVVVLCMDFSDMDMYPDAGRQIAERTMALQSVSMAGLQLLLAAHAEGLGGVWSCGPLFARETVTQVLGLPAAWEPQGMLLLGHPAEEPTARPRRPLQDVSIFR